MSFQSGLTGEAAALAGAHKALLDRLPPTVRASIFIELHRWPLLFPAEQAYQRALLDELSGASALAKSMAAITQIEAEAGLRTVATSDPGRFQEDAQALLRKRRLIGAWRTEIDTFFRGVDPAIEARLYPADAPRRLVVQIYGTGIALQDGTLWSRFKGQGVRVPLQRGDARGAEHFLAALFGGAGAQRSAAPRTGPALLAAAQAAPGAVPLDSWLIESHKALHALYAASADRSRDAAKPSATVLSYDHLREYRDALTRALYAKIQAGVESPQAFAAYARSLKIAPEVGAGGHQSDVLQAFVREVLLTGNGTLFVNNTFVEWAAVQALRRAQPRLLVARYGIRDKMKPFSSLLLFSQPRATDQIPLIEDPVGSFVDVEQLSYYVWLNAEKGAAYRRHTLYLFLAEDADEMLAIRSDRSDDGRSRPQPASLAQVCATMARWLGYGPSDAFGPPIDALVD